MQEDFGLIFRSPFKSNELKPLTCFNCFAGDLVATQAGALQVKFLVLSWERVGLLKDRKTQHLSK